MLLVLQHACTGRDGGGRGGSNLAKAAFAKTGQYLKSVAYVIPHHHTQISPLVIIPVAFLEAL